MVIDDVTCLLIVHSPKWELYIYIRFNYIYIYILWWWWQFAQILGEGVIMGDPSYTCRNLVNTIGQSATDFGIPSASSLFRSNPTWRCTRPHSSASPRRKAVGPLAWKNGAEPSVGFISLNWIKGKWFSFIFSDVYSFSTSELFGWWFGTFFIFPNIRTDNPNWLILLRGVETTNQL